MYPCQKTPLLQYSQSTDLNIPLPPLNTPEALHLALTSPTLLVLPQTPPDAHRPAFIKVVSVDLSPVEASVIPHNHGLTSIPTKPPKAVASAIPTSLAVAPKKPKTARGQFAYRCGLSGDLILVWCFIFSFFPSLSFPHLNGYLCSALSLFCLFAAPLPPQGVLTTRLTRYVLISDARF